MASNLVLNPKFIYKSDELDILGFIIECVATAVTLTRISQLAIMLHAWRTTWENFTVFSIYYPWCLCTVVIFLWPRNSVNFLFYFYWGQTTWLCCQHWMINLINYIWYYLEIRLFWDPLILLKLNFFFAESTVDESKS